MNKHIQSKKANHSLDWHPADVKAALEKAGWSLRRLAAHHGYSNAMMAHALRRQYPKAERYIAQAIGIAPEDIWPSRYIDGQPKPWPPRKKFKRRSNPQSKSNTTRGGINVNDGEAA